MQKQRLLVIVGMPGSGKSEAAGEAARLGIPVVRFGDVVRDEARRRGLKLTKENLAEVSNWFHRSNIRMMVARLRKKIPEGKFTVIDGARDPKQLAELRKYYKVETLAITSPARLRWKRELRRRRLEDIAAIKQLKERDRRELGYGLGKVIRDADYRISNLGTRKALRSKVRELLLS